MQGSAPRDVGRPSKVVPYMSQVTQWLRDDPDLSSAEVMRRVRLAGYRGGKSALYEFVRRLRVPGSGYKRCLRCRALLRDIAESCPHCGVSLPSRFSFPPVVDAEALRASREETQAFSGRAAPAVPAERYLVIAAPNRDGLYEYLKRKFGRASAIEVVRERRLADRRTQPATPTLERRRRGRRAQPALDAELRAFGFAIVIQD